MIEVNLLPEERRPVERTPLPRFLTIVGGVIGFCIEAIFIVFLMTLIPQKRGDLESLILRRDRAKDQVKLIKGFEQKIRAIEERRKSIDKLVNDRRLWGPILYRLCDPKIIPQRVWYKSLKLQDRRAAGPRSRRGAKQRQQQILLEGYAWSSDVGETASRMESVNTFIKNLQIPHPQFSEHFLGPPILDGEVSNVRLRAGAEVHPSAPREALSFTVSMPLNPTTVVAPQRR
jgi:Tfp pilus assembly protein PilN